MKRGEKQYKTMEERREDVISRYKAMSDKPETMEAIAGELGITRAYLYKMKLKRGEFARIRSEMMI